MILRQRLIGVCLIPDIRPFTDLFQTRLLGSGHGRSVYPGYRVVCKWIKLPLDYEAMARSEPTRLAKAIECGIPNAIRGMVWQNM